MSAEDCDQSLLKSLEAILIPLILVGLSQYFKEGLIPLTLLLLS